jgi:hypothetical protein
LLCCEVSQTICNNKYDDLYYSYFHSVMTYSLLFWGNSPDSIKIFRLQKRIIRIMMGCRSTDSCRKLFFNLETLPLPSQYIFSLLLFKIRNKNQFLVNSEIYHTDTRQYANFHQPSVTVTKYRLYSLLIPGNIKNFYTNFYMKFPFFLWMNILNF